MRVRVSTIRTLLREELVWNYWQRRPVDDKGIGDISQNIETQRQAVFDDVADDFGRNVDKFVHAIEVADSISSMEDELDARDIDVYDLVPDAVEFDRCVELDDVDAVRRQLLGSIQSWADDMTKDDEDHDTSSLTSHPMRPILGGAPSLRRSMGF